MNCPKCGYDGLSDGARFCPNCGESLPGASQPSIQVSVAQQVDRVVDGKATALEVGQVAGNVTIETINSTIGTLVQRALTAAEEAEKAREIEAKCLAQGVKDLVEGIQRRTDEASRVAEGKPYKGLLAYSLGDAELFFGRDEAMRGLLNRLEQDRLSVLHAESGAGKTSLLQAGISARLFAKGHLPVHLRPYDTNPALAVKQAFLPRLDDAPRLAQAPLREFLRQVSRVLGPGTAVFILLDQFEEFFTQLDESKRPEFVSELAECRKDASLNVRWVLALRTEFFGRLASFRPRLDPFANDYYLKRLTRDEAEKAAAQPVARLGVSFEKRLIDKLLNELAEGDQVAPPQLQLVCSALYEELKPGVTTITCALYEAVGGTDEILSRHLNRVLGRRLPDHQQAARLLLEALITSDRRRARRTHAELLAELAPRGVTPQALDKILMELVDSRLLQMPEVGAGGTERPYELVHDYLLEEIKLDPQAQARRAAQEILEEALDRRERYQIPTMTREELESIAAHRKGLILGSAEEILIESALKEGHDIGGWLEALGQREEDVGRVADVLTSKDREERRRAKKGFEGCSKLPERLRAALERQLTSGDTAGRRRAAEALWPWRQQVTKTHRARLHWERGHGWMREQAGQHWRTLLLTLAVIVLVALALVAWRAMELDRRDHDRSLAQAIESYRDRFSIAFSPGKLAFDGRCIWTSGWFEGWVDEDVAMPPTLTTSCGVGKDLRARLDSFSQNGLAVLGLESAGGNMWISLQQGRETDDPGFVTRFSRDTGWLEPVEVGSWPWAMAFDGTHLWVVNSMSENVMRLDPDTGQILATFDVGSEPMDLVFDGHDLWVTGDVDSVVRLRTEDGAVLDDITVGVSPMALDFDGTYLWVANELGTVARLDPNARKVNTYQVGLASDWDNWVDLAWTPAGVFISSYLDHTVVQLDPATGRLVTRFVVRRPRALTFDGANLWIASEDEGIVRLPVTLVPLEIRPNAIVSDGTYVWAAEGSDTGHLAKIRIADSRVLSTVDVVPEVGFRREVPFAMVADQDAQNLWIAYAGAYHLVHVGAQDGQVTSLNTLDTPLSANLAYDGAYVWGSSFGQVLKFDPVDGRIADIVEVQEAWGGPVWLTYGGDSVWLLTTSAGTLHKIQAGDGYEIFQVPLPPMLYLSTQSESKEGAMSLAYGGDTLWVASEAGQAVAVFRGADGELIDVLKTEKCAPVSLAYAWESMWVACKQNNTVMRLEVQRLQTQEGGVRDAVRAREVVAVGHEPVALHFDGAILWVANARDGTLTRIYADD